MTISFRKILPPHFSPAFCWSALKFASSDLHRHWGWMSWLAIQLSSVVYPCCFTSSGWCKLWRNLNLVRECSSCTPLAGSNEHSKFHWLPNQMHHFWRDESQIPLAFSHWKGGFLPIFKGKWHEKREIPNPPTLSVAAHLNHPSPTSRAPPPCMQCLEKRHKTVLRRALTASGGAAVRSISTRGRGGLYVVKIFIISDPRNVKNWCGLRKMNPAKIRLSVEGWTPPQ